MKDLARGLTIAAPTLSTRAAIWQLAHETDNSNAYLLWCTDYFDQSLIAWMNNRLAGFVIAGELRSGSDTARIVDVAVSATVSRSIVIPRLLDRLVATLAKRGISYVEAGLKSADSELRADMESLASRWKTQLELVGDGPDGMSCKIGPLRL